MNQPVQLSQQAQQIVSEVDLLPGENILYSIQGDGFFLGSNPLAKAIASLQATITKLTGGHVRVFVFITNLRVLLIHSEAAFCGFRRLRAINAIALGSITEAGTGKETQWCCIHTRTVHIESKTQRYGLVIKKLDDRAQREFVRNLSSIVVTNVHNRLAT
ncbi:MAG: hypothetical protein IPK80_11680 [Nannocystis sp.]|nr:hypothetical protein [Nannocystis sp.]